MAEAKLEFTGSAARIEAEMTKVLQKMDSLIEKMNKSNDAAEKHTKSTGEMGDMMESLAHHAETAVKGLIGFAAIEKIFDAGKEAVKGYLEYLDKTAESQNKAAAGMRSMASVFTNSKDMAAAMDKAQGLSMEYGLTTDQTAGMVKAAHIFKATHPEANEDEITKNAAGLTRLGVDAGTATEAIMGGMAAGLSPQQAADLAVQTADRTALDIGKSADLAQRFSNPYAGSAIMGELAALKGYKSPRELMSFIASAQEGLDADPNIKGPKGKFARSMAGQAGQRGMDWSKMSEIDRLNFMAAVMPDTSAAALENKGMDAGAAKQVSRLIAHRGDLAAMAGAPSEGLSAGREGDAGRVGPLAQEEESRRALAASEVGKQKGFMSDAARSREQEQVETGAQLQKAGLPNLTEGGKPTLIGRLLSFISESGLDEAGQGGISARSEKPGENFPAWVEYLKDQKTSTEEQTSVLREISSKLGGGSNVPNMSPSSSSGYISPSAGNGH